jgi:SAM-dependent methyltransferase
MQELLITPILLTWWPVAARSEDEKNFVSAAFPKKEYTNSIVASRDTNVSPLEVYDTIRSRLRENSNKEKARALDVGAGAGVSTQVMYEQLGYQNIDALDWSGDAWEENVVVNGYQPSTVHFYALDDERFLELWKKQKLPKYDIIAFNFAVNRDKALCFCQQLLKPDGLLLAPINTQQDYWLKQTYQLLDSEGRVAWSANDVGAWSVQFQPDVTAETCQGIWCAPFNGFQKLRVYETN